MTDIGADPAKKAPEGRFRLRAVDGEDLAVIAACLQGALSCYGEMGFDEEENRFALILVRYSWEKAARQVAADTGALNMDGDPTGDPSGGMPKDPVALGQQRTALRFETVDVVRLRGIDRAEPNKVLEVMTLSVREIDGRVMVHVMFADSSEVCLEAAQLDARLEDLEDLDSLDAPDEPPAS